VCRSSISWVAVLPPAQVVGLAPSALGSELAALRNGAYRVRSHIEPLIRFCGQSASWACQPSARSLFVLPENLPVKPTTKPHGGMKL
jgi:hypothetical protein